MRNTHFAIAGALVLAMTVTGCGRSTARDERTTTAAADEATRAAEREAELRRVHDEEIGRMDARVAALDRDYQQKIAKTAATPRGTAGAASARVRTELTEDVANVKKAVADLRTTTPENWWDRHEQAMKRTADDVEADVKHVTGLRSLPVAAHDKDAAAAKAERQRSAVHVAARYVCRRPARQGGLHAAGARQGEGAWVEANRTRRRTRARQEAR